MIKELEDKLDKFGAKITLIPNMFEYIKHLNDKEKKILILCRSRQAGKWGESRFKRLGICYKNIRITTCLNSVDGYGRYDLAFVQYDIEQNYEGMKSFDIIDCLWEHIHRNLSRSCHPSLNVQHFYFGNVPHCRLKTE